MASRSGSLRPDHAIARQFGDSRFGSQSGTPAPEMLRHLSQTITEYQQGRLFDDATIVLIEWMPTPRQ